MMIIKKSGKLEEFNAEKLKAGIINASLDAKTPLNEADANLIIKEIKNIVFSIRENKTSTYEVFSITIDVLKKLGFKSIIKEYIKFSIGE